jgi:hypothetical protein
VNNVELNFNALVAASTALLGAEKTNMLSELYTLLDNAEKTGEVSGYGRGHADATEENNVDAAHGDGYEQGYEDGTADANEIAMFNNADIFEEGFDEGYEVARAALGECPIVTPDFDVDEDGYLIAAIQNRYVGDND